jgi:hypothetical protein
VLEIDARTGVYAKSSGYEFEQRHYAELKESEMHRHLTGLWVRVGVLGIVHTGERTRDGSASGFVRERLSLPEAL